MLMIHLKSRFSSKYTSSFFGSVSQNRILTRETVPFDMILSILYCNFSLGLRFIVLSSSNYFLYLIKIADKKQQDI